MGLADTTLRRDSKQNRFQLLARNLSSGAWEYLDQHLACAYLGRRLARIALFIKQRIAPDPIYGNSTGKPYLF